MPRDEAHWSGGAELDMSRTVCKYVTWLTSYVGSGPSHTLPPTRLIHDPPQPVVQNRDIMRTHTSVYMQSKHECLLCGSLTDGATTIMGNPYTFQNTIVVCGQCSI